MPEYQTVNLLIVIIHRFTDSQFYIPFIPRCVFHLMSIDLQLRDNWCAKFCQ